jgi:hypothetical protein
MSEPQGPRQNLEQALDVALGRALAPPAVPADFRARLMAAITRTDDETLAETRRRLKLEEAARLADLEAGYLRLRRHTFGTLIGIAFAAGTGLALALPWLKQSLGAATPLLLGGLGAAIGVGIGVKAWLERGGVRLTP